MATEVAKDSNNSQGGGIETIQLDCATCGASFDKRATEYRRHSKKGRTDFYCTMSCFAGRGGMEERMESMRQKSAQVHAIADWADNRRDDFTGLREHLKRAKQRGDKYEGLTLDHLLEVWDAQSGKCAFTGVDLIHPTPRGKRAKFNNLASLDRIDSSKGYQNGNVQFVSVTVNHLKNNMSNSEVYEFFDIVRAAPVTVPE